MILSLRLWNFAVIDELEVTLQSGLTVLTGETGAGKSILLDALGLLVGGRATAELVRAGEDEAVVEGVFTQTPQLRTRLEDLGLPVFEQEVSVRRVVGKEGRGRVHVNGALVAVGVLSKLMRGLVDVASQHEHMTLLDASQHRELLDRLGGLTTEQGPLSGYRSAWKVLQQCDSSLSELGGDEAQVRSKLDFLVFQRDEIDRVAPKAGEDVELEAERKKLASSEKLRHLGDSAQGMIDGDAGASDRISHALRTIGDAERFDPSLHPIAERLLAAQAELEEASRLVGKYLGSLEGDPGRLAELEERLDQLKRLSRKYAAPLEAIVLKRDALTAEIELLSTRAERRAELETAREVQLKVVRQAAAHLTRARADAAEKLVSDVSGRLARLALGRARFLARLQPAEPGPHGADQIELLFSANPGEPERPLAKVASGGEASRVMLAIKAALADSDDCGCYVFDEADAGVGGAVADVVGRLIKDISAHRQVLCVTHLPQVAAHADLHLKVEKTVSRGRTTSRVDPLSSADLRAHELARMLSGVEVSREALGAAQALMRSAVRPLRPIRLEKKKATAARRFA